MRVLFVDDEPERVAVVTDTLREARPDLEVLTACTIEQAVAALHEHPVDLVVVDVFVPLGRAGGALGPRARRYALHVEHLGGLVLLDELDLVVPPPRLLVHTACTEAPLLELLASRACARVPKPAPAEVLLRAVLDALRGD